MGPSTSYMLAPNNERNHTMTDRAEQLERDVRLYMQEQQRSLQSTKSAIKAVRGQEGGSVEAALGILNTLKGVLESNVYALQDILNNDFKAWNDYHRGEGPKPE